MRDFSSYEKPSLEDLTHYGVKGMKWGVRKAAANRREIKSARARQRIRKDDIRKLQAKALETASPKGKAAAEKALAKAMDDFKSNPDYRTSKKFTALEQIGISAVSGVAALPAVPPSVTSPAVSIVSACPPATPPRPRARPRASSSSIIRAGSGRCAMP